MKDQEEIDRSDGGGSDPLQIALRGCDRGFQAGIAQLMSVLFAGSTTGGAAGIEGSLQRFERGLELYLEVYRQARILIVSKIDRQPEADF